MISGSPWAFKSSDNAVEGPKHIDAERGTGFAGVAKQYRRTGDDGAMNLRTGDASVLADLRAVLLSVATLIEGIRPGAPGARAPCVVKNCQASGARRDPLPSSSHGRPQVVFYPIMGQCL